ncbi:lamin tail domain-containing protein [Agromyces atrinae]|uniref:lamin tail domain-containing protein n=1 Tax=Agromyces atrinae TaxID=592376 RepID=UPI001F5AC539|nr:lamin tail domain-containing protein [Agromyces atrinae]MCI2956737.1 lamin tail domain-containing protein [Agromyces atrinae]
MRSRRSPLIVLLAAAVGLPLVAGAPAAAAEPATVAINEITQNSDATDWVELTNTGSSPVDLSGWWLKDDKDDRVFALAAGTVLEPGAFLAIDVDVDIPGRSGFGLGRADMVRLYAPDGVTLVDQYAWADHTATSYGRCPDGTGAFQETAGLTKGAANLCEASAADSVRINEVESNDPTGPDWIELTNIGLAPVDLSGLVVKDDNDARTSTIPAGTVLAPGAFYVIEEPVIDFGLGGADAARLFEADGTTLIDSYSWTRHADTTFGRYPDGVGEFAEMASATKGAPNDGIVAETPAIVVNEIESSGGTPGDWAEFFNASDVAVDLSGFVMTDSDPLHRYTLPAGSVIEAGGYLVVEEAQFGFGLGANDLVRLFLADGFTVVAEQAWTGHAVTTYGLCGGEFVTTTSPTKGAVNDCGAPVRINEVESKDGEPGDWIELKNNGATAIDLTGFVVKDSDDTHADTLPAGSTVAAGGYLVVDTSFGLGAADSARLFDAAGELLDEYSWTEHAATTYGRCPDGKGDFAETRESTRGAVNACVGDVLTTPWPGSPDIRTADAAGTFSGDLSGLAFDATGETLWAVENGGGMLHSLTETDGLWVPSAGAKLRYPDGTGTVDAEGVVLALDRVFVGSERNNEGGGTRPSVLRYAASGDAGDLVAEAEWNLVADLPAVGANAGIEGIAFVPDADLVERGFIDESTGAAYAPYTNGGGGVFFVGVEGTGGVYGYALDQAGDSFTRVATITSGFPGVMELEYRPELGELWVGCDDTCEGRTAVFTIGSSGVFERGVVYERPAGMPNLNNEGFAIAPAALCTDGALAVLWADDGNTDGHALRAGSLDCAVVEEPEVPNPEVPNPEVPNPEVPNPEVPVPGDPEQLPEAGPGAEPTAPKPGAALASTGVETTGALLAGFALLAFGAALIARRRARRS